MSETPADATHRPILADKYKTKSCQNFTQHGHCPYESRCMFAHGPDELRTKEMNLRDGLTSDEAIRNFRRMQFLKAEAAAAAAHHARVAAQTQQHQPEPTFYRYNAYVPCNGPCCSPARPSVAPFQTHASGYSSARVYTHNPYYQAIAPETDAAPSRSDSPASGGSIGDDSFGCDCPQCAGGSYYAGTEAYTRGYEAYAPHVSVRAEAPIMP